MFFNALRGPTREGRASRANGTQIFRGVEVTVQGVVESQNSGVLVLAGNHKRPPLFLEPIEPFDKIQWDFAKLTVRPLEQAERDAYPALLDSVRSAGGTLVATVTGPLRKSGSDYVLEVRQFALRRAVS